MGLSFQLFHAYHTSDVLRFIGYKSQNIKFDDLQEAQWDTYFQTITRVTQEAYSLAKSSHQQQEVHQLLKMEGQRFGIDFDAVAQMDNDAVAESIGIEEFHESEYAEYESNVIVEEPDEDTDTAVAMPEDDDSLITLLLQEAAAEKTSVSTPISVSCVTDTSSSPLPWCSEAFSENLLRGITTIWKKRTTNSVEKLDSKLKGCIPLTSRSVERMFSSWKRLMRRNVQTHPFIMQSLLFLRSFTLHQLKDFLAHSPVTTLTEKFVFESSTQYVQKLRNTLLLHKQILHTHTEKVKRHHNSVFRKLRMLIGSPHQQGSREHLWTRQHSVQLLANLYPGHKLEKNISATTLKNTIMNIVINTRMFFTISTIQGLKNHLQYPQLILCKAVKLPTPFTLSLPYSAVTHSPTLTLAISSNQQLDNQCHKKKKRSIVDHGRCGKLYAYLVIQQANAPEWKWETVLLEKHGSELVDYWRAKVEELKIVNLHDSHLVEAVEKQLKKDLDRSQEDSSATWDISSVVKAVLYKQSDGKDTWYDMFYQTKWCSGEITWNHSEAFFPSASLPLILFWRNTFIEHEKKRKEVEKSKRKIQRQLEELRVQAQVLQNQKKNQICHQMQGLPQKEIEHTNETMAEREREERSKREKELKPQGRDSTEEVTEVREEQTKHREERTEEGREKDTEKDKTQEGEKEGRRRRERATRKQATRK